MSRNSVKKFFYISHATSELDHDNNRVCRVYGGLYSQSGFDKLVSAKVAIIQVMAFWGYGDVTDLLERVCYK